MQITVRRTASLLFSIKKIEFAGRNRGKLLRWATVHARVGATHLHCYKTASRSTIYTYIYSVRGPNNRATKRERVRARRFSSEQSHLKKTREKENRALRFNGELKCLNMEGGCCCCCYGTGRRSFRLHVFSARASWWWLWMYGGGGAEWRNDSACVSNTAGDVDL